MFEHQFHTVAGFRFVETLGSGAFGHTYKAQRDGDLFAVKVLNELPGTREAQRRFDREIEALKVEHENLAQFVESGFDFLGGRQVAYIAMRYEVGQSLRDILADRGAVSVDEAIALGIGAARGLAALHEHGVVHRDLKPANVYVTASGRVVLLDFGLSLVQDLSSVTGPNVLVGTMRYASPEQLKGRAGLSSDLYSLGVMLYQSLTGRCPFMETTYDELAACIREAVPRAPSELRRDLPPFLDDLILALLAKQPIERPASAAEVEAVLRAGDASKAVRAPYDRSSRPILALRTMSTTAGEAVMAGVMDGGRPDLVVCPITQEGALDALYRARSTRPTMSIAVDTYVGLTSLLDNGGVKALAGRRFLPPGDDPWVPEALRARDSANALARGDLQEQMAGGADLLRAPAFPLRDRGSDWLGPNTNLIDSALHARDALNPEAPLVATVPCAIEAIMKRDDRIDLVNRLARRRPDAYWLEVPDLLAAQAPHVVVVADLALMLQQTGAPVLWKVPSHLAELAWSIGIAGVELHLGGSGSFAFRNALEITRAGKVRIAMPSLLTSVRIDYALVLIAAGIVPEADCPCAGCARGLDSDSRAPLEHNLHCWLERQTEVGQIPLLRRLDELTRRVRRAELLMTRAREVAPPLKSERHLKVLADSIDLIQRDGVLDTASRLRDVA